MRLAIVLSLCAVVLTGCKTTTVYVNTFVPIGQKCPDGTTCVEGASCILGWCTTGCATTAECWGGSECRPYGESGELTCLVPTYIKTPTAQPGTSCAIDTGVCAADPQCDPAGNCSASCGSDADCSPSFRCNPDYSICVRNLFCYSRQQDDPDSFCTQECADDLDCPAKLYCEYVSSETDRNRKICVPRKFCTPCEFDSDCDMMGGVCATDNRGGKFCTSDCVPPVDLATRVDCDPGKDVDADIDCRGVGADGRDYVCRPSPEGGWWMCKDPNLYQCPQPYSECKDAGNGRTLCFHRYGACTGDGSLCSPCRSRKDCDEAGGALCYRNYYSGERLCTATCGTGNTCPDSSYGCYTFNNECTKDSNCFAPDGKCDLATGTCTPENPPQCLKDLDVGGTAQQSNPSYPTCYPQQAGYCCD